VSLKNLIAAQLVKKYLAFCGTWRFIIVFRRTCLRYLSWARSIQSTPYTFNIYVILFCHLYLGLPSGLFSWGFPNWNSEHISHFSHACMLHVLYILSSLISHPNNVIWRLQIMKSLTVYVYWFSCYFLFLKSKYSPQNLVSIGLTAELWVLSL
jgi:hypothetical protein